jgi:hypothetical protein
MRKILYIILFFAVLSSCISERITIKYSITPPTKKVNSDITIYVDTFTDNRSTRPDEIGIYMTMYGDTPCYSPKFVNTVQYAFIDGLKLLGINDIRVLPSDEAKSGYLLKGEIISYKLVWRESVTQFGKLGLNIAKHLTISFSLVDLKTKNVIWNKVIEGRLNNSDLAEAGKWSAAGYMENLTTLSIERAVSELINDNSLISTLGEIK